MGKLEARKLEPKGCLVLDCGGHRQLRQTPRRWPLRGREGLTRERAGLAPPPFTRQVPADEMDPRWGPLCHCLCPPPGGLFFRAGFTPYSLLSHTKPGTQRGEGTQPLPGRATAFGGRVCIEVTKDPQTRVSWMEGGPQIQ